MEQAEKSLLGYCRHGISCLFFAVMIANRIPLLLFNCSAALFSCQKGYTGSKKLLTNNKQHALQDPSLDLDFSVTYTFDKAGRVGGAKHGKEGEKSYYVEVDTYY